MAKRGGGRCVQKKKEGNEKLENRKVVRRICTVYAALLRGHYCNNELRDFRKTRDLNTTENSKLLRWQRLKFSILWIILAGSLVGGYRRFGGIYDFHLQGINQHYTESIYSKPSFLYGLFYDTVNELERIWKETMVAKSRHYYGICLERLRKTTNNLVQDNWCPDRDSSRAPPEYQSRALTRVVTRPGGVLRINRTRELIRFHDVLRTHKLFSRAWCNQ
jgi:hypothetical protein